MESGEVCSESDQVYVSEHGAHSVVLPRQGTRSESMVSTIIQRKLLNQIAMIHEISKDGTIIFVNDLFCTNTGFSRSELIGATHHLICPDLKVGEFWIDRHALNNGGVFREGETQVKSKGGDDIWLSTTIAPVSNADGVITGYYCASLDETKKHEMDEKYQDTHHMIQLGQLSATVAHEIRNPLGAIRTANYVLEKKVGSKVDGVAPQLDRIKNSIRRCDKIISELLDFTRKKPLDAEDVAVDAWVGEAVADVKKDLMGSPEVNLDLGLSDKKVSFDAEQMRRVLINVLSNAAEAMAEKYKQSSDGQYTPSIEISTRIDGDYVCLRVLDNGPGIAPENITRIKDPLFTTKSFGVGLGISAIEKILQDHDGSLDISNGPVSGAVVEVRFRA